MAEGCIRVFDSVNKRQFRLCLLQDRLIGSFVVTGMLILVAAPWSWAADPQVDWASLNLTSEQASSLSEYESEWKDTCAQVLPEIKRDKDELMRLLNSPNGDPNRIMQLHSQIKANEMKLQHAAMRTYLKKKNTLSPGQQKQLHRIMGQQFKR